MCFMFINKKLVGTGSLIGATFLWGFFAVLSRTIGFKLPIFYVVWTRNLAAFLILLFPVLFFRKYSPVTKTDFFWITLRSLGGIISLIGTYVSFQFLPIGTVYFVFFGTQVVSGYLLGKWLFQENISINKILSLVLALVGLFLLYSLNIKSGKSTYVLLSVLAGFSGTIWNTFSKKTSHKYTPLFLNWLDCVMFAVICFFISLTLKEPWIMPSLTLPWIANLVFLFIVLVTGQLVIYGFKYLDAQTGSLVLLMEIVFGILVGFIFYRETITLATFIGGLLIVSAIILAEIKTPKSRKIKI